MKKKLIKSDLENIPCYWWLRSAYSDYSSNVGFVNYNGNVHNYNAYYNNGVLPACFEI